MNLIKVKPLSIRLVEIAILAGVLVVFLVAMKLAYGQTAGSLEELENEVIGTQTYHDELITYIVSHNMSIFNEDIGGLGGIKGEPLNTYVLFDPEELETWNLQMLEFGFPSHRNW